MLTAALPPNFVDNPRFFSVTSGDSLDEVCARYNIFGTSDTITLTAEMLSMNFRDCSLDRLQGILTLIQGVESGFLTHFSECNYDFIEVISADHVTILDGGTALDYLDRYAIPSMDEAFASDEIENIPSPRFSVKDRKNKWSINCFVEQSEVVDNGLFFHLETRLLQVASSDAFQQKYDRVLQIRGACARALNLEFTDA